MTGPDHPVARRKGAVESREGLVSDAGQRLRAGDPPAPSPLSPGESLTAGVVRAAESEPFNLRIIE